MFIIRTIRLFFSLPFLWAGAVLNTFGVSLGDQLVIAAWHISRSGQIGSSVIASIYKRYGLQVARKQAEEWVAKYPLVEIFAWAGILAVDDGDINRGRELLDIGLKIGSDRQGLLEFLEFSLATKLESSEETTEVARKLALRHNLSPTASKLIISHLMWDAMLSRRLDEAREHATKLLAVADDPQASIVMWALAKHAGDKREAKRHLADISGMNVEQQIYYKSIGMFGIGMGEEADAMASELRNYSDELADHLESVIREKEAMA